MAGVEADSHSKYAVGVLVVGFFLFEIKVPDYISIICVIVNARHG
jgi:hypothetical protein